MNGKYRNKGQGISLKPEHGAGLASLRTASHKRRRWILPWLVFSALVLTACQAPLEPTMVSPTSTELATPILPTVASETVAPSPTFLLTSTQTELPVTFTPPSAAQLCSPLEGYTLAEMPALVSNPYNPPPPGSDDPHQGVDLADRAEGSGIALAGRQVQAVLAGRVAAVVKDRFPYGNALLVETPFEQLPAGWVEALGLREPIPTSQPDPALTCPDVVPKTWGEGSALYLLYAHLQQAPAFQTGDGVSCGQGIGAVGDSGNALNPHLHLEVRLGPAGAVFSSLAHYDNRATLEEMDQYCTWRVRGIFRLVDPLRLLALSDK
jgi:murein DD-endopeptidase MepM/ murein hydrolase activator NlpD